MSQIDQVIRRAQKGDRDAVAILYETYRQVIYRYVAYRVSSPRDAEDLTAEVFVKMVEGLPTYRVTNAPFEAWLYRIASARVVDYRRRNNRRQVIELSENLTDQKPSMEDDALLHQEFEELRNALQQLSDDHQLILILRFVEGKTHEEVAAIIGKSLGAVKSAQYRALLHLVQLLGSAVKVRHYLRGSRD